MVSYLNAYLMYGVEADPETLPDHFCEKCRAGLASEDPGAFCNRCGDLMCQNCLRSCKQCKDEGRVEHFTPMCGNCSNDCTWHKECKETVVVV